MNRETKCPAEVLIDVANYMRGPRLVVPDWAMEGRDLARVKLALMFDKKPGIVKLRAVMERWEWDRLVQECY